MPGKIPATYLLLEDNGVILGRFNSLMEVAHKIGISVDDRGAIFFNGEESSVSYSLKQNKGSPVPIEERYSKVEAIKDWSYRYMRMNMPIGMIVHRCLRYG